MGTTSKRDEATFRYISLANSIPPLEREEELSLARAYLQQGDQQAKHRLIQANLRHVIPHALRHRSFGIPLAELIGQGNLALVGALDRFDPERGLRFATYANHWIRAEMYGLSLRERSMVGGGKGPLRARYVFKLRREYADLMSKLGDRDQVLEVLSQRFERSPDKLAEILQRIESPDASLDARLSDDGSASLGDMFAAEHQPADDVVERDELRSRVGEVVREARETWSERERFIVEQRWMADEDNRMSLREIGQHFGVSRERARQLEDGLRRRLRRRLESVDAVRDSLVAA